MVKEKQEWVYTEKGGPELKKKPLTTKLNVNKWYFITPWIIWLVAIFYGFYFGGNLAVVAFLLIVFGPVPLVYLNIKTLQILVRNAQAKSSK